ncbi:MAG: hypothetical protein BJ554DRAFT_5784 [Olpidium bornovanus]|uniref:Uncharacterized protein n=1 Tax=Olpidium bornovanus TaxID=278681 RepID=A0A8H8DKR9_9FUNG|nr:MAG: hypothetical protein BJ554DRAFT_5784 [Olpidium bornovanus]
MRRAQVNWMTPCRRGETFAALGLVGPALRAPVLRNTPDSRVPGMSVVPDLRHGGQRSDRQGHLATSSSYPPEQEARNQRFEDRQAKPQAGRGQSGPQVLCGR